MSCKLASTTALTLVLLASGATAAVTPEDVWESWQALATLSGQELVVDSATRTGDTLEVAGMVVTYKDQLGGAFSATIDRLSFRDNGDGTVTVTLPDSYPMELAFPPADGGPMSIRLTVAQPGATVTASGTPELMAHALAAPALAVTLDEVVDQDGTVLDTRATLAMTEVQAGYTLAQSGAATLVDSSFSARALSADLSGSGPDGSSPAAFTLAMTDLAGATKGNLLGAEMMANLVDALNGGFTTDSSFIFGATSLTADVTDSSGPFRFAGTATGGGFNVALDKSRISYGSSLTGASFTMSGADIPFPEVVVGFAETAFNVLAPATRSDTPQDFALLYKVVDLTVSEDIWGMVDPGGVLSREPLTFILDTKGTGRWLQDIMDPDMQLDGFQPPGELNSFDLVQFLVKAAGAEVSASGGVTIDNTDLETWQGLPAPTGSFNVTIKGVNALVDNLISLGLLPEDQAMGFRMFLGMFTRPGTGPDEVTSLIELRDGGLFANGQQLQ